jgi:hypothetical protein
MISLLSAWRSLPGKNRLAASLLSLLPLLQ